MPDRVKPLPKDKDTSVVRNQAPIRKEELPQESEATETPREYVPLMSWI